MSNIPMTLPKMALAAHEETYGHNTTFAELEGGRILRIVSSSAHHLRSLLHLLLCLLLRRLFYPHSNTQA